MSGKLGQSLDEILKDNRRTGGGRGRPRRNVKSTKPAAPVGGVKKNSKPARNVAKQAPAAKGVKISKDSKIIVSGLPKDVSEAQIKDYFANFKDQIGPVKRTELVYGPGGLSRGVVNVTFAHSDGAHKAFNRLNGLLVDNKPIKVEVVVSGDAVPEPPTLSQRISGKAQPKSAAAEKSSGKGAKPVAGAGKTAAGKKGRPRPKSSRPAKKTADELDAEMADYFDPSKGNNEATGVAPAANGDAQMEDEIM